ncbi:hypothetical protein [Pseudorhodoferax sp. Leaf267]|uniref:hypothetical protein n=1 Tax=Pseudorhodoferax sp. Leaf267 TaxID=1736316 RepID=UPI000712EB6A|nr:hypothetical protein [Pseudorhodoferax sp. Leaf267]KQP18315.1 hypothetical protein ASF43_10890 [Pseudorhodoferax sp. Leaf267]
MNCLRALALVGLLLAPGLAPAQKAAPRITVDRESYMTRCIAQLYPLDETLLDNLAKGDGFDRKARFYLRVTRDVCGCSLEQAQMALNARQQLLFAYRGFEPVEQGVGQVFEQADRDAVAKFEQEHKGYQQCAQNFDRRVREGPDGKR